MPQLGAKYVSSFRATLDMIAATETLWLQAPPTSQVKQMLRVEQLEALYEAAFLRIFAAYENFLEDALARYMAGYQSSVYTPIPVQGGRLHRTIRDALAVLYGGNQFLLWHAVLRVIDRSRSNLVGCPVESVLTANQTRLEDYARIRHRIAHASRDAATI